MIRTLPGDYIGILLPSSVGVYVSILACLLAKKTPVMLNWTAGKRSLDHAVGLLDLRAVISSKRFVSRKEIGELGLIEDLFIFLEEVRGKISWKDKIYGMWLASLGVNTLLSQLHLKEVKAEDAAVILFTSGTEALPKAVPLSHHNLLSNERAALSCIELKNSDIFYGVLPPFHSFGFSVTGLLPLLAGLKVFYAPDPNDSHGLAHDIAEWNITLFCCAPSFIRAMMRVADPSQLTSLHYLVSGAEKTPRELFEQVSSRLPHTQMIEGYGITECGPIVTVNHPYDPQKGVGRPVPEVELCVIDSVSGQRLEMGKEGEICIRGPNVFKGYLGNVRCPFISIDNEEWYCSGDRGWLESDGSLILSGRLKRFVKIGGEMLSLGGLEEELARLNQERKWSHPSEEGPTLAISVREKQSDKPLLVLFTTFDVSKEEINAALKEGGFGRIVKISEVQRLEQIPLTGTGKTHYRLLDEMLNNSAN
jgi:long-chain-fatty-acid--[acyl-carrier-protein] ligase